MDGLNRPTASTGTPREELHGGAKKTVQISNIGGGSDEDLKELLRIKEKDEQPTAEFFEAMLDDLLIHLEK